MSLESIKQRLFSQAIKDSKWLEEATWRAENEAWLDISFSIALMIGRWLRANGMTQKELAERLGYSPQYVSKILKGSENLTLETITKIEKVLGIKLIEVPFLENVSDNADELLMIEMDTDLCNEQQCRVRVINEFEAQSDTDSIGQEFHYAQYPAYANDLIPNKHLVEEPIVKSYPDPNPSEQEEIDEVSLKKKQQEDGSQ